MEKYLLGIIRYRRLYIENVDLSSIHVAVWTAYGIDANHPDLNVVAEKDIVGETTGDYSNGKDPNGHGTICRWNNWSTCRW